MYLPPAAAWTVGRGHGQRRLLLATGLLGLSLCLGVAISQPWGVSTVILLTLPVLCLVAAALGLRHSAKGQLRWDGEHWHWVDAGAQAQDHAITHMACVLDLQWLLLLRVVCAPAGVRWLWLESPSMDARWLALRRAVVASRQALQASNTKSLPE